MTTIIRVKRHFQDDPVEAVRLECKRRRTEEAEASPSFEKVLSFSGTVDKKDDLVAQRTVAASFANRKKSKEDPKNHKSDILAKVRNESRLRSEENRFKVISCLRSVSNVDELDSNSEETSNDVTIVDVDIEKNDTDLEDVYSSEDGFVYDLYSANFGNEDYNDIYLDNVIGIEPYTSQIVFDTRYRNPGEYTDEEMDPDEDDSNDENNWRNSYPDEEGSDSDEVDKLTSRFGRFARDDIYELSSDEGEESFANYTDKGDMRDYFFHEAEDLGGRRYAKYKMNALKDLKAGDCSDDGDEEETF